MRSSFGRKSRYDPIALHPAKAARSFDDYKGVWVIVEQRQGQVQDVTLELLGAGRPMAEKLGVPLTAVLLGHGTGDMADRLLRAGAHGVIVCEHPILKTPLARPSADVLTRLIKERKPEIVLIGATHTGRDISSRVAVKIDAGMTADCTELDVDEINGELLARRPAFGGKMLATIRCDRHRPQMATARPGIFKPLDPNAGAQGDVERVDVSWLDERTYAAEVLDHVVHEGVDITKEPILVAGGIGVGPDGWGKLRELAEALGGEVAASRAACDKGWVERGRQVGQTGVSVRPKLYIAVGISGAIQHIEGMKESGTVLAINNDPSAPIFQYADIGIVGDWKPAVESLIKLAEERGLKDKKWMVPRKDTLEADRQAARERALKAAEKEGKEAPQAEKAVAKPQEKPRSPAPGGAGQGRGERPRAGPDEEADPAPKGAEPGTAAAEPAEAKPTNGAVKEQAPREEAAVASTVWPAPFGGDPTDETAVKRYAEGVPEEKKAWVLAADCIVCNGCDAACPTGAAVTTDVARVDRDLCIADGACFDACPTDAIRPGTEDPEQTAGWPEGSRLAGRSGA